MLKNKSAKNKTSKESLKKPEVFIMTQSNTEELKNARSATTGEEFNSLDERIDCEIDRLNKKIEVSMLQQESAESHVVESSIEGLTTDMIIKGRTLVNIAKSHSRICTKGGTEHFKLIYPTLKIGTYTIIINASELTKEGITMYDMVQSIQYPYSLKSGLNIRKIEVREEGESYAVLIGNDNEDGTQFMLENLMILEGDWTNKEIPSYFEGIKSFGETEGNKISILSNNENYFKLTNDNIFGIGTAITVNGNSFTTTTTNGWNQGFGIQVDRIPSGKYKTVFEVIENKDKGVLYEIEYFKDNNSIKTMPLNSVQYEGIINVENIDYDYFKLKFKNGREQSPIGYKYLMLVPYDSNINTYVEKKSDKKDILLQELGFDEGLRGLSPTVCDELNDTKNMSIKRIDKCVFNGNETWYNSTVPEGTDNETIRFQTKLPNAKNNNGDKFIANYPTDSGGTINIDAENIQVSNGVLYIRIKKSKLETQDLNGFVKWLKSNPLTIYFELKEPIETPLTESINLKVFNEKTYVNFENALSGTSSFKAPVDTVATIARLNKENRVLEEENKSLRQDFESTTLVLTDSDLELVKQNVDMDFRLMEVEFALDIPQAILSSNIFKNKKGEVKSMARTPYEMMKIVILSGDYDKEDYMYKVGKYYERGRMTKEEHDELISLMTADEVISK